MFEIKRQLNLDLLERHSEAHFQENYHVTSYFHAKDLFEKAVSRGRFYRLLASVFHRPRWLLELEILKSSIILENVHYSGVKPVSLDQIIGSEQGNGNFDLAFHPVSQRSRQRWVGVATAFFSPVSLPPVELVQVGDIYFVRDGHHRISVLRALKQDFLEAKVTTWHYSWKHQSGALEKLQAYSLINP